MRALVLIVLCLAIAIPASAVPMYVTIWIFEGFTHTQVGGGGFLFDSEYFVINESSHYGYAGVIPADELDDAGIDFFAGALAGTHWEFSDVQLEWWDTYFAPGEGGLNMPQWSWGWESTAGGYPMYGGDGGASLSVGDNFFRTSWWGGMVLEDDQGDDEQASLPEPAMLPLFALGAIAVLVGARTRKGAWDARRWWAAAGGGTGSCSRDNGFSAITEPAARRRARRASLPDRGGGRRNCGVACGPR